VVGVTGFEPATSSPRTRSDALADLCESANLLVSTLVFVALKRRCGLERTRSSPSSPRSVGEGEHFGVKADAAESRRPVRVALYRLSWTFMLSGVSASRSRGHAVRPENAPASLGRQRTSYTSNHQSCETRSTSSVDSGPLILPINPRCRGHVDFTKIMPWTLELNQLGLEQADRRLGQRVVQSIADGADLGVNTSVDEMLGELGRRVLTTRIRMMHQLVGIDRFPIASQA
jgi:hypothetical protein